MTLDGSKLRERLRGIVGNAHASALVRGGAPAPVGDGSACGHTEGAAMGSRADILGGVWNAGALTIERRAGPETVHGRCRVGEFAAALGAAAHHAPVMSGSVSALPPFLFLDLETTGLNGGAGTYAFLVGCAWFDASGSFVTRQHLLANHGDERAMLEAVAVTLAGAGALVTFNGKSFDAPVLEMRYLFHRLQWPGGSLPHVDVLHPARRFWGNPLSRGAGLQARHALSHDGGSPAAGQPASCSLVALERHVVGAVRNGDVPGSDIPRRYFHFVRTADARPLAAVLEHNRLDLLSLAGITARLLQLVAGGPDAARDAREALALGRLYARAGLALQARSSFDRAADMAAEAGGPSSRSAARAWPTDDGSHWAPIRVEALRHLALAERRSGRYLQAAARWRELLEAPGCPPRLAREAIEALAIHHEHRVRDLEAAKAFALKNLEQDGRPRWEDAARRRLARLDRKMGTLTLGL